MRSWIVWALALSTVAGCEANDAAKAEPVATAHDPQRDECEKVVRHVAVDVWPPDMRPSGGEAIVIDGIIAGAASRCVEEGLSEHQAGCLLAASVDDMFAGARACLGPEEHWPSWFNGRGVSMGTHSR